MKSNDLSIDRPPRPSQPPEATRAWRVLRIGKDTLIATKRGQRRTFRVARLMFDEELDTLRIACASGVPVPETREALDAVLADPRWHEARLAYARSQAPDAWKQAVGYTD